MKLQSEISGNEVTNKENNKKIITNIGLRIHIVEKYQGDKYQGDKYQGDKYQGDKYPRLQKQLAIGVTLV